VIHGINVVVCVSITDLTTLLCIYERKYCLSEIFGAAAFFLSENSHNGFVLFAQIILSAKSSHDETAVKTEM